MRPFASPSLMADASLPIHCQARFHGLPGACLLLAPDGTVPDSSDST
ncbi:hypothetical protein ACVWYF_000826 [Hymenobacter sp. UYAg731]